MYHSKFFPECFHRVTVKGLCVRDDKVLLVHEAKEVSGKWEMPGGGLDFGEDVKDALRREVQEEMGLKVKKISDEPIYAWTHRYENNSRNIGWYYALVLVYQIELESLDFTPSEECEAIQFFSKKDLKTAELNQQVVKLADIFNPKDFVQPF